MTSSRFYVTEPDLFAEPKTLDCVPHELPHRVESHRKAAKKWIESNPEATDLFLMFARKMAAAGRHFGVKFIAERVRWELAIEHGRDFKINNNHVAYMARHLILRDKSLEKWIEFRKVNY